MYLKFKHVQIKESIFGWLITLFTKTNLGFLSRLHAHLTVG